MSIASNDVPERDKQSAVDRGASRAVNQRPFLLESDVPLSQSLIWRRQREFYVQRGLRAWSDDKVPSFITSNPFIAEIYARLVTAFLSDCAPDGRLSPENPLRILELGAGTGKFAYLFLRHLSDLVRAQGLDPAGVRYTMTDCSESHLEAWRGNPQLAEFSQSGILEFAVFEAGEAIKPTLVGGRNASGAAQRQSPLVVIANYVFDSLPQDAFVIQDGQILEALVTTSASSVGAASLKEMQLSFSNAQVAPDRYPNKSWNHILELYRSRLPAAMVMFPSAALKTLGELAGLSDGRMLVLAADKGYVHEEDLAFSQGPPAIEWHAPNCFSLMVNFDAIAKYFESLGGAALVPGKHSASLNICAFLPGRPGDAFPTTKSAYRDIQEAIGPDDLFTLFAWLNAHMEEMTVPQILAALRLTRWDPVALMRLFPVLGRQLRTVTREREDLRDAVRRTWANHYPVSPDENVLAFQCGVILLELRFFAEAMAMFKTSQKVFSGSAATSYNLGLCAQGLGHRNEELAYMVEACALDPNFEPAKAARAKLEGVLPGTRKPEEL